MSSAPPSPIPPHTVLGERARGQRLAAQHFLLVLLDTERAGTLYPLGSEVLRIGQAPDNDVVLDHPPVSRNHLVVRRQGARYPPAQPHPGKHRPRRARGRAGPQTPLLAAAQVRPRADRGRLTLLPSPPTAASRAHDRSHSHPLPQSIPGHVPAR
ncbi:MAG TPA: FHA domain-containing protein [Archangium sp.]|nr:FHA domain-containing protein [Archangium sp.]